MVKGTFFFDPGDVIYKSHFPGCPVVPGSVIVGAFVKAIKKSASRMSDIQIQNFRFQAFVKPGVYAFFVEAKANRFHCRLMLEDKVMVKGIICCEA